MITRIKLDEDYVMFISKKDLDSRLANLTPLAHNPRLLWELARTQRSQWGHVASLVFPYASRYWSSPCPLLSIFSGFVRESKDLQRFDITNFAGEPTVWTERPTSPHREGQCVAGLLGLSPFMTWLLLHQSNLVHIVKIIWPKQCSFRGHSAYWNQELMCHYLSDLTGCYLYCCSRIYKRIGTFDVGIAYSYLHPTLRCTKMFSHLVFFICINLGFKVR